MKRSDSITEIAKALAEFQSEVKQPEKTAENPHFKSKYVTLDGIVRSIHECAPKHGLSYTQMPVFNENGVGVVTIIFHQSGQFIEFDPFILPIDKKTAQSVGSGLTYSKRYSLSAAFGIVSDIDDDGNEAQKPAHPSVFVPPQPEQRNKPTVASDKQKGLIKRLLKEVTAAKGITEAEANNTIRQHLKKEIDQYTPADASKAIEILSGALKKE